MKRLAILMLLLSCSGCYRTTVRSGQPPGDGTVTSEEQWHHGFLLGLVEEDGGIDLSRRCPNGWAEVRSKLGPLQLFLTAVTVGVYAPQTITVVCAAPGAPASAPLAGYDPAPIAAPDPFPPGPPPPAQP